MDVKLLELELENTGLREELRVTNEVVHANNESLKESTRLLLRMKPTRPTISADRRMIVAGEQYFRCAGDRARCPQWKLHEGSFDASGYEIDHIVEYSKCYRGVGQLQALCPACHALKTRLSRAKEMELAYEESDCM